MEERKGDLRFNNENCLERGTVPVDLESKLWGERRKSINGGMPSVTESVSGSHRILNLKKKVLKEGNTYESKED